MEIWKKELTWKLLRLQRRRPWLMSFPEAGDGESRERKRGTLELREKERKWSSLIWRPGSVLGREGWWGMGLTGQGSKGMMHFASRDLHNLVDYFALPGIWYYTLLIFKPHWAQSTSHINRFILD